MESLKTCLFCLIFSLFITSCGQNMDVIRSQELSNTNSSQNIYDSEQGKTILITGDKKKKKNSLIIFAGEFCQTCHEEADIFIMSLKNKTKNPNGLNITTIIVEGDQEAADDFKNIHEIPWRVTFEDDHDLQESLCASSKTPCLVVADKTGEIIFRHIGRINLETLKKITGPWEI